MNIIGYWSSEAFGMILLIACVISLIWKFRTS